MFYNSHFVSKPGLIVSHSNSQIHNSKSFSQYVCTFLKQRLTPQEWFQPIWKTYNLCKHVFLSPCQFGKVKVLFITVVWAVKHVAEYTDQKRSLFGRTGSSVGRTGTPRTEAVSLKKKKRSPLLTWPIGYSLNFFLFVCFSN